ncbi:hypothetical protein D8W73_11565 [Citrobacter amalonaticus]|nr:hypothetical protein [Citrobacter amalonaticus]
MGKWANTDESGPIEGFFAVKYLCAMLHFDTGDIICAITIQSDIFSQVGHRQIFAIRWIVIIRIPRLLFPSYLSFADEIKKYKNL